MFIKINELYNFLTKNGHQRLAKVLEKIALEESDFKNKYPNIYSVWENKKDKPISAYLAQISRAEAKGIDLTKENINSFQDIIQILKGEKQREKSSKAEEILNTLKEEGIGGITEENIGLAFRAGLNQEEIIYLAKDKCNHTWEEKIDIAELFKKERLALFDKNTKLTDFKDIDEVRDEYFAKKNKSPLELEKFYESIKPIAIKNSEVIYNSKNFIVAHSKTEKAAQYWEQSCVTVNDKGVVSSGLCSAHPYSSYFNHYDKTIHSFQIITKEYETLRETPRTSFEGKNMEYNLISLSINKDNGDVSWGAPDTVNRYNEGVGAEEFFLALASEYEEICDKISKYCKENLGLEVKGLTISKTKEEVIRGVSPKNFFHFKENIPKDLFNELAYEKAKEFEPKNFFHFKEKIPKDLFNELAYEKGREFHPENFFDFKEKIPKDVFSELVYEKAKEAKTTIFGFKEKIPKDIFEKLVYEDEEEKGINPIVFFNYKEKMPKDLFDKLVYEKAKGLASREFFGFKEKIPKDVFDQLVYEKAKGLDGLLKLIGLKEKMPKDVFDELFYEKGREYPLEDLFRIREKIPKDAFDEFVNERAKELAPTAFFGFKHIIPKDAFDKLVYEKAKIADAASFFSYKEKIPKDVFDELVYEKAKEAKPGIFFKHKEDIPKDAFDEFAYEKAKEANPRVFFSEWENIPKDIFDEFAYEKTKELPLKTLLRFRRRMPKDIFNKLVMTNPSYNK